MFSFLKIQYQLGKLNNETLRLYVEKGRITPGQYEEITGIPY